MPRFGLSEFKAYCLLKPYVTETFPFGSDVLVMKVHGTMFALTPVDAKPFQMNVKCDPEFADLLRRKYPAITPGYHMNKRHWNTVVSDGSMPPPFLKRLIDDSYRLVVSDFPKRTREKIMASLVRPVTRKR